MKKEFFFFLFRVLFINATGKSETENKETEILTLSFDDFKLKYSYNNK